jgi:hypothetical protein
VWVPIKEMNAARRSFVYLLSHKLMQLQVHAQVRACILGRYVYTPAVAMAGSSMACPNIMAFKFFSFLLGAYRSVCPSCVDNV